ncbi:unnamed protein product [Bursaphelenchus xylophilus]|uniref:(pine wood nematode) hypothetical protein n=1 Tax=Bursaphelenchus xylophilus TaxID=6326 RepID=A0A7I8X2L5_BURXY|nr:unnamed protein product [Bursaphelenchus xylophilus]CAG9131238.1 unnamed protein product [Bursaphelenchus xylophilus]
MVLQPKSPYFNSCFRYRVTVMGFNDALLAQNVDHDYQPVGCVELDIALIFFLAVVVSSIIAVIMVFFTCWDYRRFWRWTQGQYPLTASRDRINSFPDNSYHQLTDEV